MDRPEFEALYYDLMTRFARTRQYLGAGRYSLPTTESLALAERLSQLYDLHPSWADDVDDMWGDDQRMNGTA